MKRLLVSMILIVATSALAGCYYDPGYSYVRGSSVGGDAYYGQGGAVYETAPSYYDGYYPNYYGGYYGYGCCYTPGVTIGVSRTWYGGRHYRGNHGYYRGGHHGGRSHGHRGNHRGNPGYRGNGKSTRPQQSHSRPPASRPRQQPSTRRHTTRSHAPRNLGGGRAPARQ